MSKRLPEIAESRLRSLYEKMDAKDGIIAEIQRHREIERKTVQEFEQAQRSRGERQGQLRDAELEAKFDENLNRARERLAKLNQRYNELCADKGQLIRLKEKCEAYVLNAGFMLPNDDVGLVRGRAVPRGVNETIIF